MLGKELSEDSMLTLWTVFAPHLPTYTPPSPTLTPPPYPPRHASTFTPSPPTQVTGNPRTRTNDVTSTTCSGWCSTATIWWIAVGPSNWSISERCSIETGAPSSMELRATTAPARLNMCWGRVYRICTYMYNVQCVDIGDVRISEMWSPRWWKSKLVRSNNRSWQIEFTTF